MKNEISLAGNSRQLLFFLYSNTDYITEILWNDTSEVYLQLRHLANQSCYSSYPRSESMQKLNFTLDTSIVLFSTQK